MKKAARQRAKPHALRRWCLALAAVLVAALLAGNAVVLFADTELHPIVPLSPWTADGGFVPDGAYFTTTDDLPAAHRGRLVEIAAKIGASSWGSWSGDDANVGSLQSPAFEAPKRLTLAVCGYPSHAGNRVSLEVVGTGESFSLTLHDSAERWEQQTTVVPRQAVGRAVRLVATDAAIGPGGWFGLGIPFAEPQRAEALRTVWPLSAMSLALLVLAWFLLPGLLLSSWLVAKYRVAHCETPIVSWAVAGLVGLSSFWAFFARPQVGTAWVLAVALTSAAALLSPRRRASLVALLRADDVWPCLLATTAIVIATLGLFHARRYGADWNWLVDPSRRFLESDLPEDDRLPWLVAWKLLHGEPLRPFLVGDWHMSDRPPLQAGMVLGPLALWNRLGLAEQAYGLMGLVLQCAWVAGSWHLLRILRVSRHHALVIIALTAATGFVALNSVFVWPKLLAAAFAVAACALVLVDRERSASRSFVWLRVGGYAALSLLAHGGTVFTLLPLGLIALWQNRHQARNLALAGSASLVLLLPWSLFQTVYDPPGNRLQKWHLAGVIAVDDRTATSAIVDAYSELGLAGAIHNKWDNVARLFAGTVDDVIDWSPEVPQVAARRRCAFFSLVSAIGLFNLGWLAVVRLLRRREAAAPGVSRTLLFAVGALLFWCVAMFGPATTLVHQGSYATTLLLFLMLATAVTSLPRPLVWLWSGTHLATFAYTWVLTDARPGGFSNIPSAVVAVVSFAWLVLIVLVVAAGGRPNGVAAPFAPVSGDE